MVTIKLTEKEAETLRQHWCNNLNYGVNGTFGNGEEYDDKREFKRAEKILEKIDKAMEE